MSTRAPTNRPVSEPGTASREAPPRAVSAADRAVAGYLDHLAVERGLAANTLVSYRRDLTRYADYLADRGIADLAGVSESVITGFLAALREGTPERVPLSASSAARTVVAVRGLHRFAMR